MTARTARIIRSRQAGFTLLELLAALVLVALGLALAAQLLMETSQMLVDAAAEQSESALPLARARLRADLNGCLNAVTVRDEDAQLTELWLVGHPTGTVRYRKAGSDLLRDVSEAGDGIWKGQTIALRNVRSWNALPALPGMVHLEIHVERRAIRRSPLPAVPGIGAPGQEEIVETLIMAPRGGGFGVGW
ncbi:MAG TPA: prepilin-type N-terminal cleavage/methylation domain-containing protein [Thermoanaerobaculia bacterium]|jgi:prepilin-type N-terminal cleavage/methylation domain-containing protein|nr:prepilin-type N-terminal cleavage/methylation domain-containing protein [Thermoanaerobaculia bacterium]